MPRPSRYPNQVKIYLDDDSFGVLKARAARRGMTPAALARELVEKETKGGAEAGILEALNYLAARQQETGEAVAAFRQVTGDNFEKLGAALKAILKNSAKG